MKAQVCGQQHITDLLFIHLFIHSLKGSTFWNNAYLFLHWVFLNVAFFTALKILFFKLDKYFDKSLSLGY